MTWAYGCSLVCRAVIGAVFTVAVVSKVHSRVAWRAYASWLAGISPQPLGWSGLAGSLAGAEAVVVLLVAMPATATLGLVAGTVLSLALTAGLAAVVHTGAREPCYCFGQSADPLGALDVARNAVLAGLAAVGVIAALAGSGRPPDGADSALAVMTGLAFALLIIFFRDLAALLTPGFATRASVPGSGSGLERR